MHGRLFGIGVGPGDPELITLKGWRILSMVEVVAYPRSMSGTARAREAVGHFIPEDVIELPLTIPFGADEAATDRAYDLAAEEMMEHLRKGRNVAYVCLGDPLFHGTFAHLMNRIGEQFRIEVVPGISTPMACAAELARPLAMGREFLKILPASAGPESLRGEITDAPATYVFIKAGSHLPELRQLLSEAGLLHVSYAIENLGLDEQRIRPLGDVKEHSTYFSTVVTFAGGRE